jgi:SNF2 family DNA or RNA helicase
MDDCQAEIYNFIEDKYIPELQKKPSGTAKDLLNKARLIRLRQAATNPSLLLKVLRDSLDRDDLNYHSTIIYDEGVYDSVIYKKIKDYDKNSNPAKFKQIREILDSDIFPKRGKVIIWTIFIQNADELQQFLDEQGIKSKLLIGRVEQSEREKIIEKFNNPENFEFQVVIANPFAVSESISLHKGCHNAIYMERDYNCANFLQSKDRIHRVGLGKDVQTNYYYLISKNSIDTIINEKLDVKIKRMEKIIDEEIPLFMRINDTDETDIIKLLLEDYARRTSEV